MKPFIFFTLSLFSILSAQAQQNFSVKGKLMGLDGEKIVYLSYYDQGHNHEDSTVTKNKAFFFQGLISEPCMAEIHVKYSIGKPFAQKVEEMREGSQMFYLEKGETTIEGETMRTALIKGGKRQSDLNLLNAWLADVNGRMYINQSKILRATVEEKESSLFPKRDALQAEADTITNDFISTHGDSYVSLDLLMQNAFLITNIDEFNRLYNSLSSTMQNSPQGRRIKELLTSASQQDVGKKAVEIDQPDTTDNLVTLSSLKGKYVLVDFWASWCGGCRAQTPALKKVYAAFKDKKFEMLAVSLDRVKTNWVKAIKDDGPTWLQVCDLKGEQNAAAKSYGVVSVPQNFLIDPNGIIIARNVSPAELNEKLSQIFDR